MIVLAIVSAATGSPLTGVIMQTRAAGGGGSATPPAPRPDQSGAFPTGARIRASERQSSCRRRQSTSRRRAPCLPQPRGCQRRAAQIGPSLAGADPVVQATSARMTCVGYRIIERRQMPCTPKPAKGVISCPAVSDRCRARPRMRDRGPDTSAPRWGHLAESLAPDTAFAPTDAGEGPRLHRPVWRGRGS